MKKLKKLTIRFEKNDIEVNFLDGIIAIIFYISNMFISYFYGYLSFQTNIFNRAFSNKIIFYLIYTIIYIVPILLVLRFRKQRISSIGIKNTKILRSILLGVLFSLPFVVIQILYGINQNYHFVNIENMIFEFIYLLICVGFVEELTFRGFIQTRIKGLIKNKWVSILLVGFMFCTMHIPFQMFNANLSLINFIQIDIIHLIITMLMHIYFVYIYTRDNNIIASTVTHTLINFSYAIFVNI